MPNEVLQELMMIDNLVNLNQERGAPRMPGGLMDPARFDVMGGMEDDGARGALGRDAPRDAEIIDDVDVEEHESAAGDSEDDNDEENNEAPVRLTLSHL